MKDIHPREHEADVHGKEKMLVQLLKQFHTCFYQLYEYGYVYEFLWRPQEALEVMIEILL